MHTTARRQRPQPRLLAFALVGIVAAGCSFEATATSAPQGSGPASTDGSAVPASALFDASVVHSISLSFDEAAYDATIQAYMSSGAKDWIEATVTIDGKEYEGVGLRLKGNSSLRSLGGGGRPGGGTGGTISADDPSSLPWLIDLNHFIDGQEHEGVSEFVIRSNSSQTALNEAVALALLEEAGLASQDAIAVRFSVNGGNAVLRLAIENPDGNWMASQFSDLGALYKAESSGDYSYRGDDPNAYAEVFDQEAGQGNADLTPLIDFLEFINTADDATFSAEIENRLDVDSFITYLAMQEVLNNFDDIDGPGNNSYLYYDGATGQFTVVPWDYNLAFGAMGGGPGGGDNGGFSPPGGFNPPSGGQNGGGPRGGFGGRSNILVQRFTAIGEYSTAVTERTAELREQLLATGVAAQILLDWTDLLETQASDLVSAATIQSEADRIASYF